MASPSPAPRRFNLTPNSLLLLRFPVVIIFSVFVSSSSSSSELGYGDQSPTWTPWPDQFHSVLVVNYSGTNQVIDLWYDWTNGRNFNIIQHQLGTLLYDLEWNNGTSFFYDYDSIPSPQCRVAHLDVGILRPNWLEGATYLGQRSVDGFLCNVWTKADFIWYYEDVLSHRPVHWLFYTGRAIHVMTFEVGAVLEDSKWQAPVYCFDKVWAEEDNTTTHPLPEYSVLRTPATGIPNGSMGALI